MYKVISDHKEFLVISKDPGVSFHKVGNDEGLHDKIKTDLNLNTLYSVHRLDKITSGLLIFAKSAGIARELSSKFRNRRVEKYYLAISDRRPRKKQGTIKGDMEKSRRGSWKLTRGNQDPAITSFFSYALGEGLRLYLLRPYTGKTHQLRVAMKSIGAPIRIFWLTSLATIHRRAAALTTCSSSLGIFSVGMPMSNMPTTTNGPCTTVS